MSQPQIVITPPGYDDVNSVLQRLGGSLADTRQLTENEMALLENPAFLSDVKHLFINCRNDIQASSTTIRVIRDFVREGGTLYASDWASSVVETAFGQLASFSPKEGREGIVHAKVSDPYLARRIGNSVPINFDMADWVLIKRFPTSADIYIMDLDRKPLAVGFRVGNGRVIFTSFHHHAQRGSHSVSENTLLEWLATLPTQHKLLLTTGLSLVQHRVASSRQMMGRAGNERQVMPVDPGNAKGLGVFVLSWDRDDSVEFSMRYLRDRETVETDKRSPNPPLVMTVRNPGRNDGVEINRHVSNGTPTAQDEPLSFVFASGMRRDLLGDPDWFTSAIVRYLQTTLEGDTTLENVIERLTVDQLQNIVRSILSGLGYVVDLRHRQGQEDRWTEIQAWSPGGSDEIPDIQVEAVIHENPVTVKNSDAATLEGLFSVPDFYPIEGEINPGTERLLVYLTFSRGNLEQSPESESPRTMRSSIEGITWRAVSSDSLSLGRERETISAQEFLENYHANITVYRAESDGA